MIFIFHFLVPTTIIICVNDDSNNCYTEILRELRAKPSSCNKFIRTMSNFSIVEA